MNALNIRHLLQQSGQSASTTAPPKTIGTISEDDDEDDDDDEEDFESEPVRVEVMSTSSRVAKDVEAPLELTSSIHVQGDSELNLEEVVVIAKDLKKRDIETLLELDKMEPGLEIFHRMDEIFIQREPGERGRYTLLDGSGAKILAALLYHEDECMGQHRSFVMSVARVDPGNDDKEPVQVFDIRRKRACESVALRAVSASMYGNNLTMNWTTGRLLGQISQLRHCFRPTFEAESASGKALMRIQGCWGGGSCNPLWACRTSDFKIYTSTTKKECSGVISKTLKPSRFTSEFPLFGARFPSDLDPLAKILIIGALFHLNITYFERKFSAIDVCILFRYCFVIALITLLAGAAKLGIIEKIFDNKSDPEPTQHVMKQIL